MIKVDRQFSPLHGVERNKLVDKLYNLLIDTLFEF